MKKALLISALGLTATLWACSGSQENDTTSATSEINTITEETVAPVQSEPLALEQALAQPIQAAPAAASENAQVALNPEHGKPGHRCEIPVGAPLNSVPNAANVNVQTNNAVPQPAVNPQIPDLGPVNPALKNSLQGLNNAGKVNPPHGQPGHDCAVPVGAPLPAK